MSCLRVEQQVLPAVPFFTNFLSKRQPYCLSCLDSPEWQKSWPSLIQEGEEFLIQNVSPYIFLHSVPSPSQASLASGNICQAPGYNGKGHLNCGTGSDTMFLWTNFTQLFNRHWASQKCQRDPRSRNPKAVCPQVYGVSTLLWVSDSYLWSVGNSNNIETSEMIISIWAHH